MNIPQKNTMIARIVICRKVRSAESVCSPSGLIEVPVSVAKTDTMTSETATRRYGSAPARPLRTVHPSLIQLTFAR